MVYVEAQRGPKKRPPHGLFLDAKRTTAAPGIDLSTGFRLRLRC